MRAECSLVLAIMIASSVIADDKNLIQQKGNQDVSATEMQHSKATVSFKKHKRPIRNVLTNAESLWPSGKVPFGFDTNVPAFTKIELLAAMQEIETSTYSGSKPCVTFVPRSSESDYVHISWTSGSSSPTSVGRDGGRQDIVVTSASARGHDDDLYVLMITLGIVPEVMRQDRNTYLNVNFTNAVSLDIFATLSGVGTSTFGLPFDYNSLALFSPYNFATDASYPVISAKESGNVIGQSVSLSPGDTALLQHAYQCTIDDSNLLNLLGDMPLNCHFHSDLCSFRQDTTDDFDWILEEGPTTTFGTGPNADHSSGSGKYAVAEARGHNYKVARLISPQLAAGDYCFRAYVNMFGKDAGQLSVKIYYSLGLEGDEFVRLQGPLPLNQWYTIYRTVTSALAFSIHIEATMGSGDQGDIALDDVYVYDGDCIEW